MSAPIEQMIDAAMRCAKCGTPGVRNCSCRDDWTPEKQLEEDADRLLAIYDAAVAYVSARREFESNQPARRYAKKRVNELYARLAALIPEGE